MCQLALRYSYIWLWKCTKKMAWKTQPYIVAIVCLLSWRFISKISAFFIQWQLDAFVHIRDFLERHKLVLLRVRFGLSARERPPASGMNETYITWECLRWRVAKLKYGGRIYVWLKWGWQWWWHTRAPAASNGYIPRIPSLVWAGRELASLCLF